MYSFGLSEWLIALIIITLAFWDWPTVPPVGGAKAPK
jgi:hypothetical protein